MDQMDRLWLQKRASSYRKMWVIFQTQRNMMTMGEWWYAHCYLLCFPCAGVDNTGTLYLNGVHLFFKCLSCTSLYIFLMFIYCRYKRNILFSKILSGDQPHLCKLSLCPSSDADVGWQSHVHDAYICLSSKALFSMAITQLVKERGQSHMVTQIAFQQSLLCNLEAFLHHCAVCYFLFLASGFCSVWSTGLQDWLSVNCPSILKLLGWSMISVTSFTKWSM